MTIEIRNASFSAGGVILCEINHSKFGWIPYSANVDDQDEIGRKIHAEALLLNPAHFVESVPVAAFGSRSEALSALSAVIDSVMAPLSQFVPLDERLGWGAKAAAASAVINGNASSNQKAMIAAEARITQEDEGELAQIIVSLSDAFSAASGAAAGIRRKYRDLIDEITDPHDYEEVISSAEGELSSLISEYFAGVSQ
ncbi:MAG: hypothetical protein IE919_09985 [Thioclava sp.]|nr:hypothetical protein [Thioclava sp.]MBD3803553.1 hypothetical protein [Thioclava sp.]